MQCEFWLICQFATLCLCGGLIITIIKNIGHWISKIFFLPLYVHMIQNAGIRIYYFFWLKDVFLCVSYFTDLWILRFTTDMRDPLPILWVVYSCAGISDVVVLGKINVSHPAITIRADVPVWCRRAIERIDGKNKIDLVVLSTVRGLLIFYLTDF